jgi:hypothetical protein
VPDPAAPAHEDAMPKPTDFFIGLIDFFAVLLPGAILAYLLLLFPWNEQLKDVLREHLSDPAAGWAAFLVMAYVLGHLLHHLGGFLDDWIYDSWFVLVRQNDLGVWLLPPFWAAQWRWLRWARRRGQVRAAYARSQAAAANAPPPSPSASAPGPLKQAEPAVEPILADEPSVQGLPLVLADGSDHPRAWAAVIATLDAARPPAGDPNRAAWERKRARAVWWQQMTPARGESSLLRRRALAVMKRQLAAAREKNPDLPPHDQDRDSMFKWALAAVRFQNPAAGAELDQAGVDSKFFRSLGCVTPVMIGVAWARLNNVGLNIGLTIAAVALGLFSLYRYCDRRWTASEQTYLYFVLQSAVGPGEPKPPPAKKPTGGE